MPKTEHIVDIEGLESEFLDQLASCGKSSYTLKNYKTDLVRFNLFLKKESNRFNIDDFGISHIEQYDIYLRNLYSSNNSRRRKIQTLRIFFDFLVNRGLFLNNPVRKLPASPKFLDIPRPTPFSDIKTLWEYLIKEENMTGALPKLISLRNQILLLLIFGPALKVSDIKNLKECDIILSDSKENPSRVMINKDKRDPYTVPLPLIFNEIFKDYIKKLKKQKEVDHLHFDELLFNANPYRILSGGLTARGQEIIFEDFRKKLLLKITPKSLRQAAIFKWLRYGHKESQIKEWLGVVPSYSLRSYKDHLKDHLYNDEFLLEIYKVFKI
jgi:site-specific recombinase XerD